MALFAFIALVPAMAQQPLKTEVKVKGDLLFIEMETKGAEPTLRMNPSPSYLELTFPKTQVGKPFSKAVDKGLIQKVVASQSKDSSLIRVFVLSKPRASLKKTDKGYRYTLSLRDLASAPKRTSVAPKKPTQTTKKPAATQSKPVATKTTNTATKPVTTAPRTVKKPVTTTSTSTKPVAAAANKKLVREYFPYKKKAALRAKTAAELAFPNVTYIVDPVLNVLLVEGTPEDIAQLEKFLRAQSPK